MMSTAIFNEHLPFCHMQAQTECSSGSKLHLLLSPEVIL